MSYDDDFEDDQLGVCVTCLNQVPESDLDDCGDCPTCQEAAAADATAPVTAPPSPNYLDRLRAEVQFADRAGTPDHHPVTDSSLMYGDLREILSIIDPPSFGGDLLATARAEAERLRSALQWCSGAPDFNPGGQARKGWVKLCAPLLAAPGSPPAEGGEG
jgi:hypothetical protein